MGTRALGSAVQVTSEAQEGPAVEVVVEVGAPRRSRLGPFWVGSPSSATRGRPGGRQGLEEPQGAVQAAWVVQAVVPEVQQEAPEEAPEGPQEA